MLTYSIVSTGSCGNCYAFSDGVDSVLVDFGVSTKKVCDYLLENGIDPDSVKAVFLTHLHPDHAGDSLQVFLKKNPVPVYLNRYSAKKDHKTFIKSGIPTSCVHFFTQGDIIRLGGFAVKSIEAFHDAPGCVSYVIEVSGMTACLITDTGYFSDEMVEAANGSDILFLESNYDDSLLETGMYPEWLKRRIRSEYGHLSNEQARRFLSRLESSDKRRVFLVHISENNNSTDAIRRVMSEERKRNGSFVILSRGEAYSEKIFAL